MSYALLLDKLSASAAIPLAVRCNNEQEFTSRARIVWARRPGIEA